MKRALLPHNEETHGGFVGEALILDAQAPRGNSKARSDTQALRGGVVLRSNKAHLRNSEHPSQGRRSPKFLSILYAPQSIGLAK